MTIDFDGLLANIAALQGETRRLIAVAGAPGSGKSTVAERLASRLDGAAVLPMDGFHFDDAVLTARGRRAFKGAPDTFDVGGLRHALARLREDREDEVAVPVFDRTLEIARAGARVIPRSTRLVIVEGNYLLLAAPPWSELHALFDRTVMVAVDEAILRRRLQARWQALGLDAHEIARKVEENDLPNGRRVVCSSVAPDWVLQL